MGKVKIFLSYHKDTPLYKSEFFQPIQVGKSLSNVDLGILGDDVGENISSLNPYYCELTAYYYVLKNYIDNCDEEYIGFGHYRRLIDLTNISEVSIPAIYGLNYSNSKKVFESFSDYDLYECCKSFDIILPCKAYMYNDTVNPILRTTEPSLNMYEQFKAEHKNDLLDSLKKIILENYPDYINAVDVCYSSNMAHFYNIYVMKKSILKEFLDWEFNVLDLLGKSIGGWQQDCYRRMAGFVGERLINIWLEAHKDRNYKLGYVPIYMIDFESEYIERANTFDFIKRYDLGQRELEALYKITSNKMNVAFALLNLLFKRGLLEDAKLFIDKCTELCSIADDYNNLAQICMPYKNIFNDKILELFKKSITLDKSNKLYAQNYLVYCSNTKNLDLIFQAWEIFIQYDLTESEKEQYNQFMNCYKLAKGLN